jgi:hypothetical protein
VADSIAVTGYVTCERLATSTPDHIFDPSVRDWMTSFFALAVGLNAVTTVLMAFRLWWVDRNISDRMDTHPRLKNTLLLLVESAALYFVLQVVVLTAFVTRSNIQFLLMGSIPPVIVRSPHFFSLPQINEHAV